MPASISFYNNIVSSYDNHNQTAIVLKTPTKHYPINIIILVQTDPTRYSIASNQHDQQSDTLNITKEKKSSDLVI